MDAIAATAENPNPFRVHDRRLILAAIDRAAAEHDGQVHAAWVRPLLPAHVEPSQIGAVVCGLVRQRVLTGTGRYLPNGNHRTRNRTKPSEIRRLTRPLTEVAS
jgi:hypothetical protein